MKKLSLLLGSLLLSGHLLAAPVIACDPSGTGSSQYPNVVCDSAGHLIDTQQPTTATLVDHSGTITTGGTSQTLSAAKSRHYFFVQNTSSANLYINFTSAASTGTGSILILPNASFTMEGIFVSSEQINIYGATTGQTFTSKDY